jgi:hypothetical protein
MEGGLWRLVYARALGRCVYRREALHIDFDQAVTWITTGELLWTPPQMFEHIGAATSIDTVQHEYALITALLQSPVGHRMSQGGVRTRLESRLNEDRNWLARRAPSSSSDDKPDAD